MMQGDDIRDLRQHAQDVWEHTKATETTRNLALWVIAEQLFELRALISISLERNK